MTTDEHQAATAVTEVDPEEIRVAIAWNGGVSLAVWMGGVAVELDCARRAPYGAEPDDDHPALPSRRVYADLSSALNRRLIPDILTGASAGGLNGALLAAVIRTGRRLSPDVLRRKWLEFGDFSKLLHRPEERAPQSLMQGDVFLDEVKLMFAALLGDETPPPTPRADTRNYEADRKAAEPPGNQTADEQNRVEPFPVLLDVMITNVLGEPRGYVDYWHNEFVAREYRAPAQFRKDEDFTTVSLATAARASSSFPAAFEPVKLSGDVAVRAGLRPGDTRWAIDGGLLENAPVTYAINLIPFARTDPSSKRFLCYLDAAPDRRAPVPSDPDPPTLQAVLGYVVNLPRDARVVDQLYAVQQATVDSGFSRELQDRLFGPDDITGIAGALFPVYRRRRTFLSLVELLRSPAEARKVFDRLRGDVPLPWLPQDPFLAAAEPDLAHGRWPWGFRAAQRLLLLERERLASAMEPRDADRIREAKRVVDTELETLEELRAEFLRSDVIHDAACRLADAETSTAADFARLPDPYQPSIAASVLRATDAFCGVVGGEYAGRVDAFVARGLAIEVIRRAISAQNDFEPAEQINFVQLTPVCPSPIFTAQPLRENGPDSPDKKLAGIRLGHFSGFYRSSWRANDFMWGRLDAAVRIVDLLLADAHDRAATMAATDRIAGALAQTLVPGDDAPDAEDLRWLAHEALADAKAPPGDRKVPTGVPAAVAEYPDADEPPPTPALREFMRTALVADLGSEDGRALFTRTVCARAAQLEIVRQELGPLARQTEVDAGLGDSTAPLDLPLRDHSVREAVIRLRECWKKPETYLPRRLGRDSPDELVSNLALQTITHAMFVGLSMARGANAALGRLLSVLRIPLLSISGVASRYWLNRIAVLASFVSAACYVAARLDQTDKSRIAPLDSLWSGWVLLSWVAALAMVAVAIVPIVRAARGDDRLHRVGQGAWAAGLLAPPVVAIVFALWWGGLGAIQVVGTPQRDTHSAQASITIHASGTIHAEGTIRTGGKTRGSPFHGTGTLKAETTIRADGTHAGPGTTEPPDWLVWLALGLVFVGVPALRTVKLPLLGAAQNVVLARVGKLPIAIIMGAVSLVVLGWSVAALVDVLDEAHWQIATAAVAFLSLPLCLAYLIFGTQRVRDRRLRDVLRRPR